MKDRNQAILFHYYFPPLPSTATHRNFELSRQWASIYQQVNLITTDIAHRFGVSGTNIRTHRVKTIDYRALKVRKSDQTLHTSEAQKGLGQAVLSRIKDTWPLNIVLDEGSLIYILGAYRKALALIKDPDKTVIYSSYRPMADHYVAYLVKRKYPQVYWIADFRDLPVEPLYKNVLWPKINTVIYRRMFHRADVITTISNGLASHLNPYNTDVRVILNGVKIRPQEELYQKFTITYTGSLFGDERDPEPLFKSIRRLIDNRKVTPNRMNIVYAGKDSIDMSSYIRDNQLDPIYQDLGFVDRKTALLMQSRSHINVLLTTASPDYQGVFTSKLTEYIGACRPICVIIKGAMDVELQTYVEQFKAGKVFNSNDMDEMALDRFILSHYNSFVRNEERTISDISIVPTWESSFRELITPKQ